MDYTNLLSRARNIVWNNKFLIVLGVIATLGAGAGGGGNNFNLPNNQNQFSPSGPNFGNQPNIPNIPDFSSPQMQSALVAFAAIFVIIIVVALAGSLITSFFVRVAEGATIAGVDQIEKGEKTTFEQSWRLGWSKKWRLFFIGIVTGLPIFIFTMTGLAIGIIALIPVFENMSRGQGNAAYAGIFQSIIVGFLVFCCCLTLISIPISIFKLGADRACMLQDTSFGGSFTQAWNVLKNNIGSALALYLIQFAIQIGLIIVMIIAAFILAFCTGGGLVLMAVYGAIESYFSAVWTLAWRDWSSRLTAEPAPMPAAEPAS